VTDGEGSAEAKRLDPAVVADLYVRHAEELHAYLLGLLRNADLAAEVLQSTFARAAERGHAAANASRRAWLFQVAHNEAIDRKRRAATEDRALRAIAWWKRLGDLTPDLVAGRTETVEQVRRAIEALPAEQGDVVRLRIYEDKTFAEIAALRQLPLGTVLTRMRLATKKLADALQSEREE